MPRKKKENSITILGETGVTEEPAELFKQRPVEDPEEMRELQELFPEVLTPPPGSEADANFYRDPLDDLEIKLPGGAESEADLLEKGGDVFPEPGEEGTESPILPQPPGDAGQETEEDQRSMLEKFTETTVLKCILTEAELKHCAEEMARIMGELSESEAELKSVSAQYKATIAKHEQHISEEAAKYRAGHEFRHVQVIVWFDYETGRVWIPTEKSRLMNISY